MSDLEKLKKVFDEVGIFYKETVDHQEDWTYLSLCNEKDKDEPVNIYSDRFMEFDEHGSLASY